MRQVIYTFCAGLLAVMAYTAMPGTASAEPVMPTAQIGTDTLLQKVQYGGGGYGGGEYRDRDYRDDVPPPRPAYRDCTDCRDDAPPPPRREYRDYRDDAPPPPRVEYREHRYEAPAPQRTEYREYRSEEPAPRPHRYRLDPGWSADGVPHFRSERFTRPYCADCAYTCNGERPCPPRCWAWRRYCHR